MPEKRIAIKAFHPLTGLRGFGAVWVVMFHLWSTPGLPFVSAGYLGVDLFFLLSGFIITHVHGREFAEFSWRVYGRFLALRVVRIFPLHIAVLGGLALFAMTAPGFVERYQAPARWDLHSFVQTLFLVNNWFGWPSLWNFPSWSLSAEWLGYLAFPFLMLAVARFDSSFHFFLAAVACISLVVLTLISTGEVLFDSAGRPGLVRMACGFAAGCMIYKYFRLAGSKPSGWVTRVAFVLMGIGIAFETFRFLAFFGFAALILGAVTEESPASRMLASRPMLFLGDLSFSIYMCHWPLIQVRNWLGSRHLISDVAGTAMTVMAIGLTSLFCWKCIEVPARTWGRRMVARRMV